MADAPNFAKLVPGFDFLQSLVKNASTALPSIGQWVAPTLDPKELEKRIEELRTVQFWLEQNARMLGATIQALEVQRMTLSTLQTMNVQMGDLRDSLTIRRPEMPKEPAALVRAPAAPAPAPAAAAPAPAKKSRRKQAAAPAAPAKPAGVVDPMQWWSALTNQFAQLAGAALKDSAADAAKSLAGAAAKQSTGAAQNTPKDAASMPAKAARNAASRRGSAGSKGAEGAA